MKGFKFTRAYKAGVLKFEPEKKEVTLEFGDIKSRLNLTPLFS